MATSSIRVKNAVTAVTYHLLQAVDNSALLNNISSIRVKNAVTAVTYHLLQAVDNSALLNNKDFEESVATTRVNNLLLG